MVHLLPAVTALLFADKNSFPYLLFFVGMNTPSEFAADPVSSASLLNPGGAPPRWLLDLAAAASFSESVTILSMRF